MQEPVSVSVSRGTRAVLECSATVGQQYNTVTRQPAYAAWVKHGREVEDSARIKVSQQWTDDDIVLHLRLEISPTNDSDEGDYTCKVKNQYGVLEREVTLTVEDDIEDRNENLVKKEISSIFRKQIKLYSMLARFVMKYSIQKRAKVDFTLKIFSQATQCGPGCSEAGGTGMELITEP